MSLDVSSSVQDQVIERVRDWLARSAKRLRHDGLDFAELKLTMREPGWDDDGTVMVTVMVEETASDAEIDGRVEGIR